MITQNQKHFKVARSPFNNFLKLKVHDISNGKPCYIIGCSLQGSLKFINTKRIDDGDTSVDISLWLMVVAQLMTLALDHGTLLGVVGGSSPVLSGGVVSQSS